MPEKQKYVQFSHLTTHNYFLVPYDCTGQCYKLLLWFPSASILSFFLFLFSDSRRGSGNECFQWN